MSICYNKVVGACCAFIFSAIGCFAQAINSDTVLKESVVDNVITSYYKSIGDQSRLYNGPEYSSYDPVIKGNPYFNDITKFVNGSVEYDGFVYKEVPILYDINKDLVVTLLFNKSAMFSLISDRVQNFDIDSHHFVYINIDTLSKQGNLSGGFYEELYNGRTGVLVKRKKTIQNISGASIETSFSPTTNIYIKKDGTYTGVSSQRSVLDVFKEKKKELKQYIRDNKISFKDNQEQAIVRVANYYDQLIE